MGLPRINNQVNSLSTESFLISLVERIDKLLLHDSHRTQSISQEVKSLEFWRSLIAECLSTFFYVFLVCSVNISWTGSLIGHTPNWIVMSLTSGLAMAILTQCFGHISGAHVNPAVTCAFLVTRNISPLRSILYIIAQSGGAIAGAALLYGVSIPGHQGALGIALAHESLSAGQIFGVEFVLTFLIVFTIFATLDINRRSMGNDSITIGSAYMVCSLTGLPASGASFNPARALGPAFVMNKWRHHWVYWIAPITGSILAGLIYEFIFDSRKSKNLRDTIDYIDKDCNNEDHYDEPEVKMSNKTIMGFPLSGSSHSNSGSSSSSTHQSNTTGYSSITSNLHNPTNTTTSNLTNLNHLQHQPIPPPHLPPHLLPHLQQQQQQQQPNLYNNNVLGHSPANTFQHTVITHDGLYMGNGNNNNNHINTSSNSHVTPLLSSSSSASSSSSSSTSASSSNYHPKFNSNNNNITTMSNNNVNSNSYAGIYGTRASTLRHLSNRMDFNNSRNEITSRDNIINTNINNNNCQPGKY